MTTVPNRDRSERRRELETRRLFADALHVPVTAIAAFLCGCPPRCRSLTRDTGLDVAVDCACCGRGVWLTEERLPGMFQCIAVVLRGENPVLHRTDGPAQVTFDRAGLPAETVWALHGIELSEQQHAWLVADPERVALVESLAGTWHASSADLIAIVKQLTMSGPTTDRG